MNIAVAGKCHGVEDRRTSMCWTHREAVPCGPAGATRGRRMVTTMLADTLRSVDPSTRAIDEELVYEAGLVAAELLSNATRVCRSEIGIRLDVHHGHIRISVYDDGPGVPHRRAPGRDEAAGRGLRIVAALSTAWGTYPSSSGKCVWSELSVAGGSLDHLPCGQPAAPA
jgi:hypothetical protein